MKKMILVAMLLCSTLTFAGHREGGSAGMGGGGNSEIEKLRNSHPSISDCDFIEVLIEEYDLDEHPPMPGTDLFSTLQNLNANCGKTAW